MQAQIIVTVTNVSAPGLCDGVAYVDTNNLVTGANLMWMQGNTVIQNGGYMVTNLCAGQYNLIFSGGGFTSTSTFTIGTNTSNPCAGLMSYCTTTPTSAPNVCDGSISVLAVGGMAPYTYQWPNISGIWSGSTINNLCTGTYSVTVIDANGCTTNSSGTVIVDSNAMNPCFGFNGNISSTNATGASACDGTATLTINGGTGPYSMVWSNGSTVQNQINLCVGTYSVTVYDNNQCSFTASTTIGNSSTNIDSVIVIGNLAAGANVIGTLSSSWMYNCTIDLGALDTAYLVSASFGNTMFTQDSLFTTWYLVDTNGNFMYVNYNYYVPFGTTGLYNLILQLYCPIKSQPVYYNIISVFNLAEAGIENNHLTDMSVYPNPVQQELTVGNVTSTYDFTILNMDGKMILNGTVSPSNAHINTSTLSNGSYFIVLKNTQNAFTFRLIK